MKAGILFSGGKDSALAAVLLSRDYEIELHSFVFDPVRPIPHLEDAARSFGYPLERNVFGRDLLETAVNAIITTGFPNQAIQMVHRNALEILASRYKVVADGTRFDDRVPRLERDEVLSLQDRFDCSYIRPLMGYGRREVDRLAAMHLQVQYGETGNIECGDYEREIREEMTRLGHNAGQFFPDRHQQSLVIGRAKQFGR
ncbi:MAG TPA: alpha hydrolase [Methanoregulaceae archaeon]|nr:alpha hydrolase [Methanoregulaceae archaeon]